MHRSWVAQEGQVPCVARTQDLLEERTGAGLPEAQSTTHNGVGGPALPLPATCGQSLDD